MYNAIAIGYNTVISNIIVTDVDVSDLINRSNNLAFEAVKKVGLPEKIYISTQLKELGDRASKLVKRKYAELHESYGESLPEFVAYANYTFHASVIGGNIFFIEAIRSGVATNNKSVKKLCTFDGYVEMEGAANTAYNYSSSLDFIEHSKGIFNNFTEGDLLDALGLYWLNQVNEKMRSTKQVDFDLMIEAFDCFEISNGDYMFRCARECASDERSHLMKSAAQIRHKETYALKSEAIDYWKRNIDPNLSNDKAAEILTDVVPVSFRKLSEYVAEAKREKIPPAS